MIPEPAADNLHSALERRYRVPVNHPDPDVNGISIRPEVWWANQLDDDFDESKTPPYEVVALKLDPTGVIEEPQTVTKTLAVEPNPDADASGGDAADIIVTKGRRVYDDLNLTVFAEGSASIPGPSGQRESYSALERARGLTRAIHRYLLNEFQSRPLDTFDSDGLPAVSDDTLYAEEFSPPLRVDGISGRGPRNVTDMVDAGGAQFDAGVRLRYWDTWTEYEYGPTAAEYASSVSTDLVQQE